MSYSIGGTTRPSRIVEEGYVLTAWITDSNLVEEVEAETQRTLECLRIESELSKASSWRERRKLNKELGRIRSERKCYENSKQNMIRVALHDGEGEEREHVLELEDSDHAFSRISKEGVYKFLHVAVYGAAAVDLRAVGKKVIATLLIGGAEAKDFGKFARPRVSI